MSDTKDKAASPPPSGKTLAKMTGGAHIQAIVPTDLGECFALAEMVFKTGVSIPRDVDSPQKLTVIFLKGMEIGLPPMAALECIGLINGKACLHSDGIPSLLWSRGFKIREWYENEDTLDKIVAHCEITRPEGDKYTFKYSAQDAKDNGLWDTREKDSKGNPNKAPWFRFKKRMVRMRCRGWLARDCAADVLKGIPIFEEQADIQLARDEYSEIKVAPKKALALQDIPDEPDKEPAKNELQEPVEAQQKPDKKPDTDYLDDINTSFAAATDLGALNEVHVHNELEIEERGLQQKVADLYEVHRLRIYDKMG